MLSWSICSIWALWEAGKASARVYGLPLLCYEPDRIVGVDAGDDIEGRCPERVRVIGHDCGNQNGSDMDNLLRVTLYYCLKYRRSMLTDRSGNASR